MMMKDTGPRLKDPIRLTLAADDENPGSYDVADGPSYDMMSERVDRPGDETVQTQTVLEEWNARFTIRRRPALRIGTKADIYDKRTRQTFRIVGQALKSARGRAIGFLVLYARDLGIQPTPETDYQIGVGGYVYGVGNFIFGFKD